MVNDKTSKWLDILLAKEKKEYTTKEKIADISKDIHNKISKYFQKKWKPTTESKEIIEMKNSKLDKKNFKIKTTQDRKVITRWWIPRVLENPEWDVRKCLRWEHTWEQFFTGDVLNTNWQVIQEWSATRETKKAGKKLPASWTTYRDIIENKYKWDYQLFVKKEKMLFPKGRDPQDRSMFQHGPSDEFFLRCADGSYFYGNKEGWDHNIWADSFGYSVRCLKD